jgi:hypothetical protein
MNKVNALVATVCLIALGARPALAQPPPAKPNPVAAGVEAGFSLSRVSPDASGQTITRGPGMLAGGYLQLPLFTTIGLQLELLYTQKHSHLSSTTDLNLDYVELPILAKLKLIKAIYMLEGVALSVPLRAKVATAGSAAVDVKGQINRPDIGMVIGGGIPVSSRVSVEFRYEGGFKAVNTSPTAALQRNRSLSGIGRVRF